MTERRGSFWRFRGLQTVGFCLAMNALLWSVVDTAEAQRKVIRLDAIKVEGRIQKPQAFYILQRSNLNFKSLELKQDFIPKIKTSVEKSPF